MPGRKPLEDELMGYMRKLSNWGRWGRDDQLGTINHITSEQRKGAAALVKEGVSVTMSRLISPNMDLGAADVTTLPMVYMRGTGGDYIGREQSTNPQGVGDFFGIFYHGLTTTHLDSLAHIFWDGKMYNDYPATLVNSFRGATRESIDVLKDGIVTRGVLIDMAKVKGVKWQEPGEGTFPEDLEEAEKALGVRVRQGDVLFLRTGELRRRNEEGPVKLMEVGFPGFDGASLPWLHERQVAIIGADTATDVRPSGYSSLALPVHSIAIPHMGLWLLDNANLEDVAAACERYSRWEFMVTLAPLRVDGGTGCPINPIATF